MDIFNPDTLQDGVVIPLGNQGENDAVELRFDITAWLAEWPGGAVTISYKRPDDPGVYPVPPTKIQISGNTLVWKISQVVTAYSGHGQAVITYTQGDVVRKSPRVNTYVKPGLPAAGAAPAPIPDYVDEINQLAAGILVTLNEAEDAKEAAEAAKGAAETAEQNAEDAAAAAASAAQTAISERLGGLSLSVDPTDKGLNITYTY